jgi:hypothetical protein
VKLGDQGYWWALVNGTAGLAAPLDYAWEVSSCLLDMYGTGAALGGDADGEDEIRSAMHHVEPEGAFGGQALLPRLLHLCVRVRPARGPRVLTGRSNCLGDVDVYWEWDGWAAGADEWQHLHARWGATVRHHVGWKWAWLNTAPRSGAHRRSSGARVALHVVEPVVFADEVFARAEGLLA